jgi:hypothetical protein
MISDETIFSMAPMSSGYRASTLLFLGAWIGGTVACLIFAPWYTAAMVLGIGALVLFITLAFYRPMGVRIVDEALVIRWMMRQRTIPLSDIEAVEPGQLHRPWGMKVAGCNGLYGSFGLYRRQGQCRDIYITNADSAVLLKCRDHRPLIISPAEAERFMEIVGRYLPAHSS